MEFQLSYFKSSKMMLSKCCTQYATKFGKLSSGHRTGKGQFSFQSQKRAMPKNAHYHTIALISHASKGMLKIFQARLQQEVNWELPDEQARFRKGRGTRGQMANICWSQKKQENSRKTFPAPLTTLKLLTVWITTNCGQFLEKGIPDHPTCLLRNLYAGQEASYNQTWNNRLVPNWEEVCQGYILSPCLFNLYAEYIMRDAGLHETQAGIMTAGRNINNLRYADDSTLRAGSKEELKSLLMKMKEEWKSRLKT